MRRIGPEAEIESAVARRLPSLFPSTEYPVWTAGSLPVGAGMPDLTVMAYEPEVVALARSDMSTPRILAYLRAVGRAKLDTITSQFRQSRKIIVRCLDDLVAARAVELGADVFSVAPKWRRILPDIITIEAKVAHWQKAVTQAARNRIFAHRSFVALPQRVAERVKDEQQFRLLGLGLLAVAGDDVILLRDSRRHQPRVWSYYYHLAAVAAKHLGGGSDAIRRADRSGEEGLSGLRLCRQANT
jgi:hypothetical protein